MDPDTDEIIFEEEVTQEDYIARFPGGCAKYICDVRIYWPGINTLKPETIVEVTVESPIV